MLFLVERNGSYNSRYVLVRWIRFSIEKLNTIENPQSILFSLLSMHELFLLQNPHAIRYSLMHKNIRPQFVQSRAN